MLKTILAALTGLGGDRAILETAVAAAAIEQAHIDVFHVGLDAENILQIAGATPFPHTVALGKISGDIASEQSARHVAAKFAFEDICRRLCLATNDRPSGKAEISINWIEGKGFFADETSLRASFYDLTVAAREVQMGASALTDMLVQSGRPLLIAPGKCGKSLGEKIAIAWKPGTAAARAITAAGPFLRNAKRIMVLAAAENGTPAEDLRRSAEDFLNVFRWEGPPVDFHLISNTGDAADSLRHAAYDLDADLLVMGAYGHSRAREVLFGGVTRSMLADCDIPVLMFR